MESSTGRVVIAVLVATMLISVLGSIATLTKLGGLKALTGAWGGNGTTQFAATNLTVQTNLVINFSDDTANFGSGYVAAGSVFCEISTDGRNTSGCLGFSVPNGLILENTGNRLAAVKISNTNYTSSLLFDSANNSGYGWKFENLSKATCNGANLTGGNFTPGVPPWGVYENISTTYLPSVNWTLCNTFNYTAGNDQINISIRFYITTTTRASANPLSDTWQVVAVDAGQ